jgi:F0F1-type ATP synthase assembly protein I
VSAVSGGEEGRPHEPSASTPSTDIDDLVEELRRRLAELPEVFAATRSVATSGRAASTTSSSSDRARQLRRAILAGRMVGILVGGFAFHALSTRL